MKHGQPVTMKYLADVAGGQPRLSQEVRRGPPVASRRLQSLLRSRGLSGMTDYHEAGDDDEWDYYIVHDSIGVSHVLRRPKGKPPQIGCVGCDD